MSQRAATAIWSAFHDLAVYCAAVCALAGRIRMAQAFTLAAMAGVLMVVLHLAGAPT